MKYWLFFIIVCITSCTSKKTEPVVVKSPLEMQLEKLDLVLPQKATDLCHRKVTDSGKYVFVMSREDTITVVIDSVEIAFDSLSTYDFKDEQIVLASDTNVYYTQLLNVVKELSIKDNGRIAIHFLYQGKDGFYTIRRNFNFPNINQVIMKFKAKDLIELYYVPFYDRLSHRGNDLLHHEININDIDSLLPGFYFNPKASGLYPNRVNVATLNSERIIHHSERMLKDTLIGEANRKLLKEFIEDNEAKIEFVKAFGEYQKLPELSVISIDVEEATLLENTTFDQVMKFNLQIDQKIWKLRDVFSQKRFNKHYCELHSKNEELKIRFVEHVVPDDIIFLNSFEWNLPEQTEIIQ